MNSGSPASQGRTASVWRALAGKRKSFTAIQSPELTCCQAKNSLEARIVKPIMNLDDVEFDDVEDNGIYTSSRGQISDHIGARKLGYNLTVLPPGKVQCPFHNHHGEEEMFLILEGEGELRFGDKRYPIRKHDVIACPPGGPEVAHQIINTGATTMRYLALSTLVDVETCEYPDSQKILIVTGLRGERGLRKMFRAENTVDYYDREKS
jgi:uncharacterized cupin superfamily protein